MRRIGLTLLLLAARPGIAAEPVPIAPGAATKVGLASVVVRESKGQLGDKTRVMVLRNQVYRNERMSTSGDKETLLHLRLLDHTVITLGPSSEIVLDDFAIDPKAGTAEVQVNISRGLLRFVGGKHAGAGVRYRVKTPVATIGVRGTSFNLRVDEDGGTTVQLKEGELALVNAAGDEVLIDDPNEASTVDESGAAPTEPEIDPELEAEFDALDLSPEQEAEDQLIEEEMDEEPIETIEDEDVDNDEVGFDTQDEESADESDEEDEDPFDANGLLDDANDFDESVNNDSGPEESDNDDSANAEPDEEDSADEDEEPDDDDDDDDFMRALR